MTPSVSPSPTPAPATVSDTSMPWWIYAAIAGGVALLAFAAHRYNAAKQREAQLGKLTRGNGGFAAPYQQQQHLQQQQQGVGMSMNPLQGVQIIQQQQQYQAGMAGGATAVAAAAVAQAVHMQQNSAALGAAPQQPVVVMQQSPLRTQVVKGSKNVSAGQVNKMVRQIQKGGNTPAAVQPPPAPAAKPKADAGGGFDGCD